jgi:hypothetical protein
VTAEPSRHSWTLWCDDDSECSAAFEMPGSLVGARRSAKSEGWDSTETDDGEPSAEADGYDFCPKHA